MLPYTHAAANRGCQPILSKDRPNIQRSAHPFIHHFDKMRGHFPFSDSPNPPFSLGLDFDPFNTYAMLACTYRGSIQGSQPILSKDRPTIQRSAHPFIHHFDKMRVLFPSKGQPNPPVSPHKALTPIITCAMPPCTYEDAIRECQPLLIKIRLNIVRSAHPFLITETMTQFGKTWISSHSPFSSQSLIPQCDI